jgi:hypothetical protein
MSKIESYHLNSWLRDRGIKLDWDHTQVLRYYLENELTKSERRENLLDKLKLRKRSPEYLIRIASEIQIIDEGLDYRSLINYGCNELGILKYEIDELLDRYEMSESRGDLS